MKSLYSWFKEPYRQKYDGHFHRKDGSVVECYTSISRLRWMTKVLGRILLILLTVGGLTGIVIALWRVTH